MARSTSRYLGWCLHKRNSVAGILIFTQKGSRMELKQMRIYSLRSMVTMAMNDWGRVQGHCGDYRSRLFDLALVDAGSLARGWVELCDVDVNLYQTTHVIY